MTPAKRWLAILLGLGLGVLAYLALVRLDLAIAGAFWRTGSGFYLAGWPPVQWVYRGLPWVIGGIVAALVAALIWSYASGGRAERQHRRALWFLMLSLAIGPGLITNTVLKDHWGRPRPYQLERFGGELHYVAPGVPSTQCDHNCSFVCGHCAAAFWLISLAWIDRRRRRRWLALGLTVGALVSLVRLAQGGHFLSDALGALAVVWLTNAALFRVMGLGGHPPAPS